MNQCSCKIILRKELVSKRTGLAPVALQAFVNKKRVVISLNLYISPDHWDPKRETIIGRASQTNDLRLVIDNAKAKATEIFTEYRLLDTHLTAKRFRELYLDESSRKDFIKFYEFEMNQRFANGVISKGTFKSHNNTLIKLKAFNKGDSLPFSDINEKWLDRFDAWHLKAIKKKTDKYGRAPVNESINTRHNATKNIRTYLNMATKDEAIRFKNPFKSGNPIRQVSGTREFLSPSEIRKLVELYLRGDLIPVQKGVLARFLCSCFTSIRISDHMRLDVQYLEGDYLVFVPKKTQRIQKTVKIPLNNASRFFIKEITTKDLQQISDQKTNMHLKGIAALAGIKKHLTSHVGRHTFATTFLMMGGQVHVLQQIMAHHDIKTTMVYVHLIDDHLMSQMQIMNSIASDLLPELPK